MEQGRRLHLFQGELFQLEHVLGPSHCHYDRLSLAGDGFKQVIDHPGRHGRGWEATALGVRSTPTFFVNGRKVEGAIPYETFKDAIDQALKPSA